MVFLESKFVVEVEYSVIRLYFSEKCFFNS